MTAPSTSSPIIVGVGASAGGLEAFTRLLHGLPPDAGLAYVLVQHLSPDHESLLPDLLARRTAIPIVQAQDGARVEADHAYVIPPDTIMSLTDGHLKLVRRGKGRGPHLPIDTFLCSLAEVHAAGAVAVILSGAGSDGARGVEAIKELGGIVFAQDSKSARYPSMPDAAVATGCVDFVLPPEEIGEQLGRIGHHLEATTQPSPPETVDTTTKDDVRAILKLLQRHTGVDFSEYRLGTVQRRILRRILVHRVSGESEYLERLRNDAGELELLYEDLLIGVTSFFRDTEVFDELRQTVFPELMRSRSPGEPFRIWVAGCSGGEETYSLAIALIEFLDAAGSTPPIQIFGTDLSEVAVARARAGLYPESIAKQVSAERLRRFFVFEQGKYRIAKSVRDLCVFSRQNILRDPPFSRLDLISCRNVLIYLEPGAQRRVFPIFHYALKPGAMLLLGSAESPGLASESFEPVSKRHKVYRRRPVSRRPLDLELVTRPPARSFAVPVATAPARQPTVIEKWSDLGRQLDALILARYGGQGVVVNDQLEIIHFRGDTADLLGHAPGAASLDLLQLARSELRVPLRSALNEAASSRSPQREKHIKLRIGESVRYVTIDVLPLISPSVNILAFAVLFTDEPPPALMESQASHEQSGRRTLDESDEVRRLRDELAATNRYLSDIVEQHSATVEELRAAGEEIQSSNEELQSTNEELETTKEEVQSSNEELTTLNEELRHRNLELSELASDLANVLATTSVPIVIVGRDLRLRRFTPATSRIMRVISTDVGRPLSDVKLRFTLPHIERLVASAFETLTASDHLVQDDENAWWSLTIRPYQTVDRRVEGAVMVFSDVDATKRSEEKAEQTSESRRRALVAAEEARVVALGRAHDALAAGLAERERAERDRNELLRKLDSAQEEERRRLSRELHDEVGQHLTALGLGLQALSDVAPADSELDRRAEDLRMLAGTLGRELHGIALRLRPKVLDDFGLEPALASYADEWSRQSGITVDVHAPADGERLPPSVENAAYRIAQEALTNVAKHSGASHASVVVERRDNQLHVIIEDNGGGFDANAIARVAGVGAGLGLLGIRERVALLGGTVEIESAAGRGTTLFVHIPLDNSNAPEPQAREEQTGA